MKMVWSDRISILDTTPIDPPEIPLGSLRYSQTKVTAIAEAWVDHEN